MNFKPEILPDNRLFLIMRFPLLVFVFLIFLSWSGHSQNSIEIPKIIQTFDSLRQRNIPLAIYSQENYADRKPLIFSHGYGMNDPQSYLSYSYLTSYLASQGYFVVSIQHELPTDSLLPLEGIPRVVRRSNWERGVENIHFVVDYLKKSYPELNFQEITLGGHSNGGDMVALFPNLYPNEVHRIFTLDNRRMPLPGNHHLKVLSIRSSDQPADDGVLPDSHELKDFAIEIITLKNTQHNDMDDHASEEQRREIQQLLANFLR